MTSEWIISWMLSNFGASMFLLAIILVLLNRLFSRKASGYEILYRWIALLPLGFTAIYAFVLHAFYPEFTAHTIGWQNSPFQFEVASANLGFGLIAMISFGASYGFRLATVIGNTCWLWGDAVVHIFQMMGYHNYAIGNAGTWFWLDVFIPVLLIACITQIRRQVR